MAATISAVDVTSAAFGIVVRLTTPRGESGEIGFTPSLARELAGQLTLHADRAEAAMSLAFGLGEIDQGVAKPLTGGDSGTVSLGGHGGAPP